MYPRVEIQHPTSVAVGSNLPVSGWGGNVFLKPCYFNKVIDSFQLILYSASLYIAVTGKSQVHRLIAIALRKPVTSQIPAATVWGTSGSTPRAPRPVSQPSPSLYRLLANGAELAEVPSINGAEYKQNKAFISQAVVSLLIYFTVHRLYVCACVFSAGVICSSE